MLIEILRGTSGRLDFARPVALSSAQAEQFRALLERMYDVVEFLQADSFARRRVGQGKKFPREWVPDELRLAVDPSLDTDEVAARLGRSAMSVGRMSVNFLPRFDDHARAAGWNLADKKALKGYIEEFLKFEKAEIERTRRQRRREAQESNPDWVKKQVETLQSRLDDVTRMLRSPVLANDRLRNEKKEIETEIQRLKAFLTKD